MKILLHLRLVSPALGGRLAADPELAKALGAKPNGPWFLFKNGVDPDGPVLQRVVDHAHAVGEELDFLRELQFTRAELAAATHLEVLCRKTVGQSRAEVNATLRDYHANAPASTKEAQVHVPARVFLSRAVPPENISHVDQYTGEYVLGSAAARALEASGFSGWRLAPVLHWKTLAPMPEVAMHLGACGLLPPALRCATTFSVRDVDSIVLKRYGALSYALGSLRDSPDFARTAEPWGAWSTPQWIVRQRVRDWYAQAGLRGWAFWPVLEQGTPLHREHEERWGRLLARLQGAGAGVTV